MSQHWIPIFAQAATGTGQLQQGLRLPPLLGRDVTAVQGSLGNTVPAQDTNNTLGWAGIGVGVVAGRSGISHLLKSFRFVVQSLRQ